MAINYTFNIGSVKRRLTEGDFSDVIVEASFGVSASSDAVTTGSVETEDLVIPNLVLTTAAVVQKLSL